VEKQLGLGGALVGTTGAVAGTNLGWAVARREQIGRWGGRLGWELLEVVMLE